MGTIRFGGRVWLWIVPKVAKEWIRVVYSVPKVVLIRPTDSTVSVLPRPWLPKGRLGGRESKTRIITASHHHLITLPILVRLTVVVSQILK